MGNVSDSAYTKSIIITIACTININIITIHVYNVYIIQVPVILHLHSSLSWYSNVTIFNKLFIRSPITLFKHYSIGIVCNYCSIGIICNHLHWCATILGSLFCTFESVTVLQPNDSCQRKLKGTWWVCSWLTTKCCYCGTPLAIKVYWHPP